MSSTGDNPYRRRAIASVQGERFEIFGSGGGQPPVGDGTADEPYFLLDGAAVPVSVPRIEYRPRWRAKPEAPANLVAVPKTAVTDWWSEGTLARWRGRWYTAVAPGAAESVELAASTEHEPEPAGWNKRERAAWDRVVPLSEIEELRTVQSRVGRPGPRTLDGYEVVQ